MQSIGTILRNPWLWALFGLLAAAALFVWMLDRIGLTNLGNIGSVKDLINTVGASLLWPVPGYRRVSSGFGPRTAPVPGASTNHNGIDIPAPVGTLIVSPANGVVSSITNSGTGGRQMTITHDDGAVSGYAHLQEWLVEKGERVTRGEPIGLVGNTGNVSGPHLHFTWRPQAGAAHMDPAPLFA